MFSGPEVWIVLAVVLLVFGSSNLPKLARSLGRAQTEFRQGLTDARRDETNSPAADMPAETTDTDSTAPTETSA